MNRKVWIGLAIVTGIVVLGAAAYLGVNLITTGRFGVGLQAAGPGGAGGPVLFKNGQRISIQMLPAPELPKTPPDVRGQLVQMKDNVLSVAASSMAGGQSVSVSSGGADSGPSVSGSPTGTPSGPTTEVVVTQDTKIYRDATLDSMPPPSAGGTIQQKVEPYTLDQAAKDGADAVTAWGSKRGDRLVADVVLLSKNVMFVRKVGSP